MIILKSRGSTARSWGVYLKSIGNSGLVYLDLPNSTNTATFHWNDTSPTSSVFTLGSGSVTGSAEDFIGYCWTEIEGFSKVGSFGNNDANGPFVWCGFKPWVMVKNIDDSSRDWGIMIVVAILLILGINILKANQPDVEGTATFGDFFSNGFKWRYTGAMNQSGAT